MPAPSSGAPAAPAAPAVLVAITGGTSSGKTTFTRALVERLADLTPVVVNQDAYFRDLAHLQESEREAARTANRPEAVFWEALLPQLAALKRGEAVEHPAPGTRAAARGDAPATWGPSRLIIVEGHLLLVDKRLRELADLKVFIDCDVELRVLRRITRDTSRPGTSVERSLEWYWRDVLPNNQRYTTLQRSHADLIVPHDHPNPLAARALAAAIRDLVNRAGGPGGAPDAHPESVPAESGR